MSGVCSKEIYLENDESDGDGDGHGIDACDFGSEDVPLLLKK